MSNVRTVRTSPGTWCVDTLLVQVRTGESVAWAELHRRYEPFVRRACAKAGLRGEDVRDLGQDVFRAVALHLRKFSAPAGDIDDAFRAWLWAVTKNKLRDHFRQRRFAQRLPEESDSSFDLAVPVAEPEDGELSERGQRCRAALDKVRAGVAPQTWQAFWRTTIDGVDTDLVASELGMTAEGVRQARSRLLRRLKAELGTASASA